MAGNDATAWSTALRGKELVEDTRWFAVLVGEDKQAHPRRRQHSSTIAPSELLIFFISSCCLLAAVYSSSVSLHEAD